MKRLLGLAALYLPICLFAQGFGSFSHDQPYLAKDRTSGGIPTSTFYGWYDAALLLTNFAGTTTPPANLEKLGTWGAYRGNLSYLIASRGGGVDDPLYLSTGSNTNGPAIQNSDFYAGQFRQFSRTAVAWSGAASISQPFTVFVVVKKTVSNPNGSEGIFGSENDKTALNIKTTTAGAITMFAGSTVTGSSTAIATVGTWYLITAQFNGASSFIRTNGVAYVSGDAGGNALVGPSIGMYSSLETLIGNYSDFVFYDRALDTSEIQTVEAVLKTKNGL